MCLEWIKSALETLPGTDDALFQTVWKQKRLLFDGRQGIADIIDYHSACLITAALRRGGRLLLTLPDFQPHRPAFLLATALIRHFLDSHSRAGSTSPRNDNVLYFGPSIGIREQLRRTSVQGLRVDLAQVFSQHDVRRGSTNTTGPVSPLDSSSANLPHVITAYSPVDPIGMLRTYRPCWIAIDCSDAPSLAWLLPLLEEATRQGIPIVAWGQNPLSECVGDFNLLGHTFTWPWNSPCLLRGELDTLLEPKDPISIKPLIICGKASESFSSSLSDVYHILSRATHHAENSGRLIKDAIAIHWKYLRSLESLAVPIDFYEAEAQQFWGLQSFGKLEAVCDRFRSYCMQGDAVLYQDLESVAALLQQAKNDIEEMGCLLWEALVNLCIDDIETDDSRLLVFPSGSRKQLFLFSMLARHNTGEDDLREMGTYVTSLIELGRWVRGSQAILKQENDIFSIRPPNGGYYPVIVGLPNPVMTPRILYALFHPKVDIVLYPHQRSSFMRRQSEWSDCMSGNMGRNLDSLACMSRITKPSTPHSLHGRISVEIPEEMDVRTAKRTPTTLDGSFWKPDDPVTEVARLFRADNEFESEELILNDHVETGIHHPDDIHDQICVEVVKVKFDQGWFGYFASDDEINVITHDGLDSRYVRSLRNGERVLFIHGQKRQSLYDLIISRVHKHPSIELHLVMIRRWQEDLKIAFAKWCSSTGDYSELEAFGKRDLDGLLRRMRARKSRLESSAALHFWLEGFVLCPQDPEDLLRVSEILSMGFVQKNYKRISQAAIRLRGLHRGLSRRLNHWLQDQITGTVQGREDDVIDTELGLTFGDVKSSLLVMHIEEIEIVPEPFLRSTLGRIEREV